MDCSEGMISGFTKLLFWKLWPLDVSHTRFLKGVVSIIGLLRVKTTCNTMNSLSDQRRMSSASRKGKGKRMVNQVEETGRGTQA